MTTAGLLRIGLVGLLVGVLAPASSRADDGAGSPRPLARFPGPRPIEPRPEPDYFRALLMELGLLAIGNVDYLLNTAARGGTPRPGEKRWDLRYDWPTFQRKLSGDLWRVDDNQFNTNYISHPFAGTMFYTAARANGVSIVEAAGYATLTSLTWEYFSELREIVSVNDVIATPVGGVAIGETFVQLGAFFGRGRSTFANRALALLFTPLRTFLDVADGRSPDRAIAVDHHGLPEDGWHVFTVHGGGGVAIQTSARTGARRVWGSPKLGLDMRLVRLPGYDGAGDASLTFRDANVARFTLEGSHGSERVADLRFSTHVVPAGIWEHHVTPDARGRLRGQGFFVGLLMTFDYTVHDGDRDGARPLDVIASMSPIGMTAEYTLFAGPLRVRPSLDISAIFAGFTPYAFDAYRSQATPARKEELPSVLSRKSYEHGLGIDVAPQVVFSMGAFDLGWRTRVQSIAALQGRDEAEPKPRATITDRRVTGGAWTAYRHARSGVGARLDVETWLRDGQLNDAKASQSEVAIMGTTSWTF